MYVPYTHEHYCFLRSLSLIDLAQRYIDVHFLTSSSPSVLVNLPSSVDLRALLGELLHGADVDTLSDWEVAIIEERLVSEIVSAASSFHLIDVVLLISLVEMVLLLLDARGEVVVDLKV